MKTKLTQRVNFIIGACIALFIAYMVMIMQIHTGSIADGMDSSTSYIIENELPPIDPIVSETIPHNIYRMLTDSIKYTRAMKNGHFEGIFIMGFLGFQTNTWCENCTIRFPEKNANHKDYLISLGGWKLDTSSENSFPVKYFAKNGKPYLRKTICKSNKPANNNNASFSCREENVAIPYKIDPYTKSPMVSVSENTFKITRAIFICAWILFFIYFVYFVLGGFIQFLVEIARGTPFSERNVRRLRFVMLNLLFIPLGLFLINLLLIPLIFHSYFTSDIRLDDESWKSLGKPAILYLIFMALYTAFKKGKQLKDESDLTV